MFTYLWMSATEPLKVKYWYRFDSKRLRNSINRISHGHRAHRPLCIQLLGRNYEVPVLQPRKLWFRKVLIVTQILNGKVNTQSQHSIAHSPKFIWFFPPCSANPGSGVFKSHSLLHYLQKSFLLLTLDLKSEYRGRTCMEQLYYPLNETVMYKTSKQTTENYVESRGL